MERRVYFVAGDLLATGVAGWLAALVVLDWTPWQGSTMHTMMGGMALGMMTGMLTAFVFIPVFGAMEVMLPVMLAGMVSGMLTGMGLALDWLDPGLAGPVGIASGVLGYLWTFLVHLRVGGTLHGP
ncbi:MAG: hypothetical protein HQL76_00845 [Magnetococcales bacterium]|nr:hypothetical protein [Magnetococcales bacterium]